MKNSISKRIRKISLKQGGGLYLFPFGSDGVVTVVGSISGGHLHARHPVLADVHAAMLTEGTRRTSKRKIQEKLDSLGASISFSPSQTRLQFTLHCRKGALPTVIELVGEMLSVPSFPVSELAIIKKHLEGALDTEAENTRAQAGISFAKLVYEKSHPNYEDATELKRVALRELTRRQLVEYHKKTHGRSSLILAASGDVTPSTLKHLADTHFKDLPRSKMEIALVQGKEVPRIKGTEVVHIPGKASVDYIVGTRLYIQKTHSDYPALILGSRILGNRGFTGRLMRIVRKQEGLTYGVYAYLNGFEAGIDGDMIIWGTFAPQLFGRGRASVKRELYRFIRKGFGTKEFKVHQDLMLANWYVNLSNTGALASAIHEAVLEGGGVEYLDTFPASIQRLTVSSTLAALKRHVDENAFAEAAAGSVEKDALSS